ncbi:transcriptional regulator [Vibrio inusitatus NBRC 102082]|uniref:Transcriptional regulator n=1 Tax=Vibrio inusitatus NBRC 102082 TaxID=1219070 RepID=A0A4Y3HYV5_9VIBR|nr:transcriptional regulator [Vibrio inusitatus NBRC 102082]
MARKVKASSTPDLNRPFSLPLLGQAVKARRTQAGITLADAASLSGVAKQTFINIEKGSSDVKVSSLMQVIVAMGVKLCIEPWSGMRDDDSLSGSVIKGSRKRLGGEGDEWV